MLTFQRLSGADLERYIPELARLRIRVFRDFPYLYEGDLAYEERYLQTYIQGQGSVVVLAFDGDEIVGASTGLPLSQETDEVLLPFQNANLPIADIFYCGESVLLKEYRGQGAGVAFFNEREAHARELGCKWSCFCGVQRPDDHPMRPADFVPLGNFWRNRGYEKRPELATTFSWKEIGEANESPKPMTFWMKAL
jgi:GNAT superfamily N-acetyltransferase